MAAAASSSSQATKKHYEYLILGGGNSAGYMAKEFAAHGVSGNKVGIVSAEPVPPYERPALTKAYLHPPTAKARARLPGFHTCVGVGADRQDPEWYTKNGIDFHGNTKIVKLDIGSKLACSENGSEFTFDKLLLATGARAIRASQFGVKGDDLPGVHTLRDESDAAKVVADMETLQKSKPGSANVIVVGGGYIGMETTAVSLGWNFNVSMIFPEKALAERIFPAPISEAMENEMKSRGAKIIKGEVVASFNAGKDGKVESVTLKSGQTLPCDLAIVGVGAALNTELVKDQLQMAKKEEGGGIIVDGTFKTSNEDVYAVGDVASYPSSSGNRQRLEHVDNARKTAAHAVKCILGKESAGFSYETPFFYSRMFEYSDNPVVFNMFGSRANAAQEVVFGKPATGEKAYGALFLDSGNSIQGGILVNAEKEQYDSLKKAVEARTKISGGAKEIEEKGFAFVTSLL